MNSVNNFDDNKENATTVHNSKKELDKDRAGKTYAKITVEDIENIEEFWDILDPVYWTIDIYSSYEEYLNSAKDFTLEQRYLNAISWYFMEVNNGGHFQELLDKADSVVYDLYDYDYTFEMKYIKSHPDKFVFEGYYNKIV